MEYGKLGIKLTQKVEKAEDFLQKFDYDLQLFAKDCSEIMSINKVSDGYLKKKSIDAHQLKGEIIGKANISKYDIYVNKDTGELMIYRKDGRDEEIPTGEFIK